MENSLFRELTGSSYEELVAQLQPGETLAVELKTKLPLARVLWLALHGVYILDVKVALVVSSPEAYARIKAAQRLPIGRWIAVPNSDEFNPLGAI